MDSIYETVWLANFSSGRQPESEVIPHAKLLKFLLNLLISTKINSSGQQVKSSEFFAKFVFVPA